MFKRRERKCKRKGVPVYRFLSNQSWPSLTFSEDFQQQSFLLSLNPIE
jgi:hypothetical protein